MAKWTGWAIISLIATALFCFFGIHGGWLLAAWVFIGAPSFAVLIMYAVGLATTGDWRCYRDMLW